MSRITTIHGTFVADHLINLLGHFPNIGKEMEHELLYQGYQVALLSSPKTLWYKA